MISNFEMFRTSVNHIGSAPLQQTPRDIASGKTESTEKRTFDSYLLDAMEYVNGKQQASSDIAQKLITDPDSVDVHDVTIAMAEANLSLSMAQSIIDRMLKGWTEITTTR